MVDNDVKKQHIALIDGYGFLFRAYYSLPPLTDPNGLVVGALYGYSNMLLKLRQKLRVSHIVVMLDSGKKTFRNEIYKEYKANRPPAPDDLIPQFPLIRDVHDAMNIVTLEKVNYEADDLIATIATLAKQGDFDITIISSDKDLTQLVDESIKIYDPMKQKIMDINAVYEKYGVYPKQMQDFLSLVGDASDNIPGVPSIGPKTATELLTNFESLEGIFANIDKIDKVKRQEKLIAYKEQAFLSQKLVKLEKNIKLDIGLDDLFVKDIDVNKLGLFFEKYGFDSLLDKIGYSKLEEQGAKEIKFNINEITEKKQFNQLFDILSIEDSIFMDMSLNRFLFATKNHIYWGRLNNQTKVSLLDSGQQYVELCDIYNIVQKLLIDPTVTKIFIDFKQYYRNYINQTSAANKTSFTKYKHIFDLEIINYLLANNKEKVAINLDALDNSEDIIKNIQSVYQNYYNGLAELTKLEHFSLFWNTDLLLNNLLLEMERNGFRLDQKQLYELTEEFLSKIKVLEQQIYAISEQEFNIGSPKQLADILFNKLSITSNKKSKKTKSLSTSQEVLEDLAAQGYDIAQLVLQWRHFAKLKNTYTEALPKLINPVTNRVHSNFSNTGTSTGRLSSNNPNLQNIPIRSKEGDLIRSAFICEEGNCLVAADYSQIELRLLAHIAKVKKLQIAFANNQDIHAITASEVFGVELEKIDSTHRRMAKAINFGIIYGISAFGLAKRLQISNKEAKEYIDLYFTRYPEIKDYMNNIVVSCKEQGYVKTLLGRKLFFPNLANANPMTKGFLERAVINAPLQGSAADIIKKAMLDINHVIEKKNLPVKLLLQVHDELIYEVPKDQAQNAAELIKNTMQNVLKLDVSLDVSVGIGSNWGELK